MARGIRESWHNLNNYFSLQMFYHFCDLRIKDEFIKYTKNVADWFSINNFKNITLKSK